MEALVFIQGKVLLKKEVQTNKFHRALTIRTSIQVFQLYLFLIIIRKMRKCRKICLKEMESTLLLIQSMVQKKMNSKINLVSQH